MDEPGEEVKITASGPIQNSLSPGSPNQLDSQGMAKISGLDCSQRYYVTFSPDVTEKDFDNLFNSYKGIISSLTAELNGIWLAPATDDTRPQCMVYEAYYQSVKAGNYPGLDVMDIAKSFITGVVEAFYSLWKGLRDIFLWVTDPDSWKKVGDMLSDPEKLAAQIKEAADGVEKMLSLLKDEALLFLMTNAIICYFKMLTPQQIADMASNSLGQMFVQVVISLIIPASLLGSMGEKTLDAAFLVGGGTATATPR